jgi:hypothetical protein
MDVVTVGAEMLSAKRSDDNIAAFHFSEDLRIGKNHGLLLVHYNGWQAASRRPAEFTHSVKWNLENFDREARVSDGFLLLR